MEHLPGQSRSIVFCTDLEPAAFNLPSEELFPTRNILEDNEDVFTLTICIERVFLARGFLSLCFPRDARLVVGWFFVVPVDRGNRVILLMKLEIQSVGVKARSDISRHGITYLVHFYESNRNLRNSVRFFEISPFEIKLFIRWLNCSR